MDVLAAWRSGVKNGVASMGTSLTSEQIYLLEQTANKLFICYDGDTPGQNATKRALELIAPLSKFEIGVISLPEKLDPDEFVNKYGTDKFKEFIAQNKQTELEFYLEYFKQDRNLEKENDQLSYITDVLEKVATVKDPVARDLALNRLAKDFGIERVNLNSQLQSFIQQTQAQEIKENQTASYKRSDQVSYSTQQRQEQKRYSPLEQAERLLLYRILHDHDVFTRIQNLADFAFVHEDYETIYLLAEGYFDRYASYESASFLDYLKDENLRQLIISLELTEYGEVSEQEISDCLNFIIQRSPLETQISEVQAKINQAKRIGDAQAVVTHTAKLIELLQKKQTEKSII